jgi:hypothetical protein
VNGLATLCGIVGEMKEIHVEVIFFEYVQTINSNNLQVLFANFKSNVRDTLKIGGFYDQVPKERLFPTVHDAVIKGVGPILFQTGKFQPKRVVF